jgi:hypothetical protein
MKLPFGTPKVDDGIWIVSFMHNDLGFIDVEQKALQPLRHRVVTDISGTFRYLCLRSGQPDHVEGAAIGGGEL